MAREVHRGIADARGDGAAGGATNTQVQWASWYASTSTSATIAIVPKAVRARGEGAGAVAMPRC